jgi:phosphatidylinositol alpha-mannosyltransferase
VGEDEKLRRLAGADVFCAPSLGGESFGVVLLEGMAAGCAVVASDLDGYRNVGRAGIDALMVPPGQVDALAAALRLALAGGPAIDRLKASGRDRAAHFSLDRLATRYLEMYEQVVARPRSTAAGRAGDQVPGVVRRGIRPSRRRRRVR